MGLTQLDIASFGRIGQQVDELVASGRGIVLVSSGARKRLPSVGWKGVVDAWDRLYALKRQVSYLPGESLIILTAVATFLPPPVWAVVAVVNANDPILAEDSPYRNNDLVAAALTEQVGRELFGKGDVQLGILSDVNGVLTEVDNPKSVIRLIDDIDAYAHLAGNTGSEGAAGGMKTKFEAARIALKHGIRTWIAHGRMERAVHHALQGRTGTHLWHRQRTMRAHDCQVVYSKTV